MPFLLISLNLGFVKNTGLHGPFEPVATLLKRLEIRVASKPDFKTLNFIKNTYMCPKYEK